MWQILVFRRICWPCFTGKGARKAETRGRLAKNLAGNRCLLSKENNHRACQTCHFIFYRINLRLSHPCIFLLFPANSWQLALVPRSIIRKWLEMNISLWNITTHYVYCNKLQLNKIDDVHTREAGGGGWFFFHHENVHGLTTPLKIISTGHSTPDSAPDSTPHTQLQSKRPHVDPESI